MNGRGSIFGDDTVIDISRPHTHTGEGHPKPTALQTAARAKYTKHHRGYQALGIGLLPFIVDTMGRLHDDALRTIWHLASRQIARNYVRRGWQAGGGTNVITSAIARVGPGSLHWSVPCVRRLQVCASDCPWLPHVASPTTAVTSHNHVERGVPHAGNGNFMTLRLGQDST